MFPWESVTDYEYHPNLLEHYISKYGINLEMKRGPNGNTGIHIGAKYGKIHLIRVLVENEVDINSKNSLGETPLHYAAKFGNFDCVRALVKNGAEINTLDNNGITPQLLALRFSRNSRIIGFFSHMTNYMDIQDTYGDTPLHKALLSENIRELKELIDSKIDTEVSNSCFKETPLHLAVETDFFNGAVVLLRAGANPNAKDITGRTPFHYAVANKNIDMVLLLRTFKANINELDNEGISSLALANPIVDKDLLDCAREPFDFVRLKRRLKLDKFI